MRSGLACHSGPLWDTRKGQCQKATLYENGTGLDRGVSSLQMTENLKKLTAAHYMELS